MPPPPPPLSPSAEQSQVATAQDISQRSSTPSQLRMLRDMFDEQPDWWTEDNSLGLGSQVDLDSFARGLPTGTQSQVVGRATTATTGSSQRIRELDSEDAADELPREQQLSSEDDLGMWDVAGNISIQSNSSSLPADVVDFLATLSQCDMEDIEG